MIPCKHWRDCGVVGGGCCAKDAYDRPSFGTCLQLCQAYEGPDRGAGDTVARVIKAATLGRVTPCKKCGKRRQKLNRVLPYS